MSRPKVFTAIVSEHDTLMPPTMDPRTKKKAAPKKPPARKAAAEQPPAKKPPAKKTVAKKAADKKTTGKKAAAKHVAAGPKPAGEPRHDEQAPASEQHRRAVAAVKEMFRLWPAEAARWIVHASSKGARTVEVLEGRWIEQAPRGPAYVVPPPHERESDDRPTTKEALLGQLLKRAIMSEATESKGKLNIEVVDFDFAEAARQTLAKGGAEIELWLRAAVDKRAPVETLLGVIPAGEHDDGADMHWTVLRNTSWHLMAYKQLIGLKDNRAPSFEVVPLYLWPLTGLLDPQENCSVIRGELELPGLLGALLSMRGEKQRAHEQAENRKWNLRRLALHQALDQERREAAARRRALTGDAGITEEQLASLVPDIDVDNDRITMSQHYNIIRLWDEPFDALLATLPPGCLGLALFGYRPPDMSAAHALERCAFTLRRELQGDQAGSARRAALSLSALGSVFVEPADVARLFTRMRLL